MPMYRKTVPCISKFSSFPEYGRLSHLDERELDLGKTANTRSNADEYEKRLRGRLRAVEEPQAGRRKQLLALSLGEKAAPAGTWNAPP